MLLKVISAYLVGMNVVGLFIMYADKQKAKAGKWRIPESTLFLISAIGGSFGTMVGMYLFRHKTKHWYFVIGMPLIFIVHVIIAAVLVKMGIVHLGM